MYLFDVLVFLVQLFGGGSGGQATVSMCQDGQAVIEVPISEILTPPITLSVLGLPPGVSVGYSENPVLALPATVDITFTGDGSAISASYPLSVVETAVGGMEDRPWTLLIYDVNPTAPLQMLPADGATNTSRYPTMTWLPGQSYRSVTLEIDDDPGFGSIDYRVSGITETGFTVDPISAMLAQTTYFWRIVPDNPCGGGAPSDVWSYTTAPASCSFAGLAIPDATPAGVTSTIEIIDDMLITDFELEVFVDHDRVADLELRLTHLDTGTEITLVDRPGIPLSALGCEEADLRCVFHDTGNIQAEVMCRVVGPAIVGQVRPTQAFDFFDGESSLGMWELTVVDHEPGVTGDLQAWCLVPSAAETCVSDRDLRAMMTDWPDPVWITDLVDAANIQCPEFLSVHP